MLFEEQVARKPNKYPWTQDFIDSIWSGFWTPNEFSFKSDYAQFKTEMSKEEREVITKTLCAIGQVEIAVKRFWAQLGDNLPHPSMYDLGYAMANTEVIHNQAYEKLLDTLGLGNSFEVNLKEPVFAGRYNYLKKYLSKKYEDDRKQYVYAIILFTLFVENVSLFSQFYTVLWFNRHRNLLKDTAQQIQYTRLEESLHSQIGIKLINTLRDEYPELFDEDLQKRVEEECLEAFGAESNLVEWMLDEYDSQGLNSPVLKEYIKNRLNTSMIQIGFFPQFEIDKELLEETKWMDEETLGNSMTDFFHKRPVEYSRNNRAFEEEELF